MRSIVLTTKISHLLLARLMGQYCFACWRLSSSSVTLHNRPAGGFSRAGQAMMSSLLESNYSSTVTLQGGPVRLRPVMASPCWLSDDLTMMMNNYFMSNHGAVI